MLRNLLFPYWAVSLMTGAKSFRDNPLIGSRRLNERGLHSGRMKLAHVLARRRREKLGQAVAPQYRSQFEQNGFIAIPDYLDSDTFEKLCDTVMNTQAPAREMVQGDTVTRRIAIGDEYRALAPTVGALVDRPDWRAMMRYVASTATEPLYYIQTIVKRNGSGPVDPQTSLHSDTFHPTMKAWFFLHDVAEDEGPFSYVPGSHLATPERLEWERERSIQAARGPDFLSSRGSMRIDPDELPALGLPPARRLAVKANTLVIADTCGFHARAPSAKDTKRIEIWAYARRNPFLPWTGGDPLSLRPLAGKRIAALWRTRDLLKRWVGQPWTDAGRKLPGD